MNENNYKSNNNIRTKEQTKNVPYFKNTVKKVLLDLDKILVQS